MRVPVLTGSLSSIVFLADRETSVEEINNALQDAARDARWSGVLATVTDPLVSSDIVGDPHGAVVDLSLTKVIDGDLCAVYSWYDNEFGFTNTLLAHVVECAALKPIWRKRDFRQGTHHDVGASRNAPWRSQMDTAVDRPRWARW
jgi:glyceraldehyde 3-phosphate dehydrogenase